MPWEQHLQRVVIHKFLTSTLGWRLDAVFRENQDVNVTTSDCEMSLARFPRVSPQVGDHISMGSVAVIMGVWTWSLTGSARKIWDAIARSTWLAR